jgi:DNA polymerase (family 10)
MRETIGDIDLLAAADEPGAATNAFARLPSIREVLAHGPTKVSALLADGLQVDLLVVEPASWGAALQHFTGSKEHNIALRTLAIERGFRLNEYGVYEEPSGRRVAGSTEESVYRVLHMEWMPPELRENRGEIQAAQAGQLPTLVEVADLRGDLHVHSDWSDGTASIEDMARAARDFGLRYIALTDHTQSLAVANGLTPARFREQRPIVDRLNRELAPFRVLWGAEVDILPDGSLDLPDDLLDELDYVGVSIHTGFRLSREAMTERIVKGISHPRVCTLNHPTGRMLNRRPGYELDLERVLHVAAERGVAVEINGQPNRLDLDDVWARRAKELGCRLTIDSDAHNPGDFAYLRYGTAVARRGWLGSDDVRNTLPLPAFERWLATRRRRRAA